MWGQVETNKVVGGLFPNDGDGDAWGDKVVGFRRSRFLTIDEGARHARAECEPRRSIRRRERPHRAASAPSRLHTLILSARSEYLTAEKTRKLNFER
jgi:hypothetical protein